MPDQPALTFSEARAAGVWAAPAPAEPAADQPDPTAVHPDVAIPEAALPPAYVPATDRVLREPAPRDHDQADVDHRGILTARLHQADQRITELHAAVTRAEQERDQARRLAEFRAGVIRRHANEATTAGLVINAIRTARSRAFRRTVADLGGFADAVDEILATYDEQPQPANTAEQPVRCADCAAGLPSAVHLLDGCPQPAGHVRDKHHTSTTYDTTTGSYRWSCSCGEGSRPILPMHAAESLAESHRAASVPPAPAQVGCILGPKRPADNRGDIAEPRILAALEVMGWPDDRQASADVEPDGWELTGAGHYWATMEDVIRAADQAAPAPVTDIVTLCGSTRFRDAFHHANRELTLAGNIVLAPGVFGHADGIQPTDEQKTALDALHLRKIDLADEVVIVNVGGYIGDSTRREIAYAEQTGKPIRYLADPERTAR